MPQRGLHHVLLNLSVLQAPDRDWEYSQRFAMAVRARVNVENGSEPLYAAERGLKYVFRNWIIKHQQLELFLNP
jgi:hypothetical protein